jgi:hypothetical protein
MDAPEERRSAAHDVAPAGLCNATVGTYVYRITRDRWGDVRALNPAVSAADLPV